MFFSGSEGMIRYYLMGWSILLLAIGMNLLAMRVGMATWYTYLQSAGEFGFVRATAALSIGERVFLYVLYPGILGFLMFVWKVLLNRMGIS
jgi:hypothetical protein